MGLGLPNLALIDWQLFCTLTLYDEEHSDSWVIKRWFALHRMVCRWFRVYQPNLLWCLRSELGETTGRRHYHALLGGLPMSTLHKVTCFAIKNSAENYGFGMCRVYVFNPQLDGVGYVLKGLDEAVCKHTTGASLYEFMKFQPFKVMLSTALIRVIEKRDHKGQTLPVKRSETAARLTAGAEHTSGTVQKPVSSAMKDTGRCYSSSQAKTRSSHGSPVRSGQGNKAAVNDLEEALSTAYRS